MPALPARPRRFRLRLLLRLARLGRTLAAAPVKVFALAAVVIPAFAGLLVHAGAGDESARLERDRLRATAQVMAEHGNAILGLTVALGQVVASEAAARGIDAVEHDRAFRDWLTELVARSPFIRIIVVTDPTGRTVSASAGFPPADLNYSERDHFAALEAGHPGPFLGRPFLGRTSEQSIFPVALAVRDDQGGFLGTAQIGVWTDYLGRVLVRDQSSRTSVAWLRADGWLLQRIPEASYPRRIDPEGSLAVLAGLRSVRGRQALADIFASTAPLEVAVANLPDWPLAVIVANPTSTGGSDGLSRLVLAAFALCTAASLAIGVAVLGLRTGSERMA